MAKEFFQDIEKRFDKNEKLDIGILLISLFSIRYIDKDNGEKRNKDADTTPQKKSVTSECISCFFYGAEGHKKKHCTNYHTWHVKKFMLFNLVCFEANLTLVPKYT